MNKKLRETIVRHILANLALIPSEFINVGSTKSLRSKDFVLSETMPFVLEDGTEVDRKVWGCQVSVDSQELKILLADCSLEKDIPEYALLVQLKDNPSYGVYLINAAQVDNEAMIACSLDGKNWMECQTYLQATFLAGMEQVRDIGFSWSKCSGYKDQLSALRSFIHFHHAHFEEQHEG